MYDFGLSASCNIMLLWLFDISGIMFGALVRKLVVIVQDYWISGDSSVHTTWRLPGNLEPDRKVRKGKWTISWRLRARKDLKAWVSIQPKSFRVSLKIYLALRHLRRVFLLPQQKRTTPNQVLSLHQHQLQKYCLNVEEWEGQQPLTTYSVCSRFTG